MWMADKNSAEQVRAIDFKSVRDEGLANLKDIAERNADQTLSAEEIRGYLTRNIAFQMDEDMIKGLQLFFDLASKHELIDEMKHLKFIGE